MLKNIHIIPFKDFVDQKLPCLKEQIEHDYLSNDIDFLKKRL